MRPWILVVIACSAVSLVLELLDFDPPVSVLQVVLDVAVLGLAGYLLRHPPRWRERGGSTE